MKISIKPPRQKGPLFGRPAFVVIGMMRSGSNLLERQLDLLPDVRCHGELFNPDFVGLAHTGQGWPAGFERNDVARRAADEEAFFALLDRACDRRVMGMRVFLDHSPTAIARLLYDPAVKKIVLTRHLLEAFVSLETAVQTDVWLSTEEAQAPPAPVHVDVNRLITFALRQSLFYNDIQTVLHRTAQPYQLVRYGEFGELSKLNEIAAFVGSSHLFSEVPQPLHKQNPGPLKERIADYPKLLAELKRRQLARWLAC